MILISHGTGGTELNHHNLGTRLARDGHLVAAVRHEGDNWQDRSLITSGRYFSERPLQISRMLDALLASPVSVPDRRIRAVVVMAPMAVVFTPESLAAITVPVRVIVAERDVVLNGGYHDGHVVASLPRAQASSVAGAGHFPFMAQPTFPLPSAAGDAAANPAGFDRSAFLPELENQVAGFFAEQWR